MEKLRGLHPESALEAAADELQEHTHLHGSTQISMVLCESIAWFFPVREDIGTPNEPLALQARVAQSRTIGVGRSQHRRP